MPNSSGPEVVDRRFINSGGPSDAHPASAATKATTAHRLLSIPTIFSPVQMPEGPVFGSILPQAPAKVTRSFRARR